MTITYDFQEDWLGVSFSDAFLHIIKHKVF